MTRPADLARRALARLTRDRRTPELVPPSTDAPPCGACHRLTGHALWCPAVAGPVAPPCGGCRGLGAHRAWCVAVVGQTAARYGRWAETADAMGDTIGGNDPALANAAYRLSSHWLVAAARASRTGGPR